MRKRRALEFPGGLEAKPLQRETGECSHSPSRWEMGSRTGSGKSWRRDAMPQGAGQTGKRPDRETAKKNAGRKARQLFDFATIGGAITFQRGTAGRIRRRWEEVATKQTNSLLLICSAQRAYARSSLASLLCKKRASTRPLPGPCPARPSSCLRTRRIARHCAIRAVDAEGVGRSGAAASAAVVPGLAAGGTHPFRLCATQHRSRPGFQPCMLFRGSRRRARPAVRRSSVPPWTAGSRGRRRCAPCSSVRTGRRNRCRSSAPPPPAAAAPVRNCPR